MRIILQVLLLKTCSFSKKRKRFEACFPTKTEEVICNWCMFPSCPLPRAPDRKQFFRCRLVSHLYFPSSPSGFQVWLCRLVPHIFPVCLPSGFLLRLPLPRCLPAWSFLPPIQEFTERPLTSRARTYFPTCYLDLPGVYGFDFGVEPTSSCFNVSDTLVAKPAN